jgi:CBS domain containing-hemolysin-like protein
MGTLEIVIRLIAGVALVLANAMFVAVEFSLTRLRQFPEDQFQESAALRRAWDMTDRLEVYLTGCQVGISLTSIVLGIVAEPAVTFMLEPLFEVLGIGGKTASFLSIALAVFIINFVHKIWGEQTPTYLGVERPIEVAAFLSGPLYWWSKIMYPLIIAGDSVAKWTLSLFGVEMTRSWTEEGGPEDVPQAGTPQFRKHLVETLTEALLDPERRDEIVGAYEIGETCAEEIMIPADELVVLRAGAPFRENLQVLRDTDFTRYPLVGDSIDDFRGTIYLPAVVAELDALEAGDVDLEELAGEPVRIEHDTSVDEVVDILQEAREELAMITRDDRIIGAITATDSFEAIIGSLEDPLD